MQFFWPIILFAFLLFVTCAKLCSKLFHHCAVFSPCIIRMYLREWFGNFDGTVLSEDTNWVLGANKDTDSLTVTLPRSAIATQPFFQIQEAASVILRATPEIFPFPPKSMFAKADLNELFEIEPFECCDVADCIAKLGDPGVNQTITCESNACVVTE